MVDEDRTTTSLGHGSLIVSLLLNLAPTAVIYVCRVCRNLESATHRNTTRQLSSALDWAETHVDITIAGLMVAEERRPLDTVHANKTTISMEKDAGVCRVFFANARRQHLMSDSITVLGVDVNRAQLPCSGRPILEVPRGRTFCTMAQEIPCDWMGNKISGYEVAGVILAALAAIFLEYDSSDNACEAAEDSNLPSVITKASDRDIIQSLFFFIGTEMGKDQWYIEPTKLGTSLTRDPKSFYRNIRKQAMQDLPVPLPTILRGNRSITKKRRRVPQTSTYLGQGP
ncbi:hypothetical protein CCHR01_14510 [Colletotrichum chrysophilum]|uniref:Uncharacterized protein n=1 Tax=Colletotrichum chrysophilum TaxID=1836956 RepID=A0AAD9ECP1_9PEZI|nr:hypothetical protein CCHR01_14510 [Colletotrichum chrysophilum]